MVSRASAVESRRVATARSRGTNIEHEVARKKRRDALLVIVGAEDERKADVAARKRLIVRHELVRERHDEVERRVARAT